MNLYSSFTDGRVDGVCVSSRVGSDGKSKIAYVTNNGDAPMHLTFSDHGAIGQENSPYRGRYPSACLVYENNWYIGIYSLDDLEDTNYGILGPEVQYAIEIKGDTLQILVYPGADGSLKLYEDEGENYIYEKGEYSIIPITWNEKKYTDPWQKKR